MDEKHVLAYVVKGNILISLEDWNSATFSFEKAYLYCKDIVIFSGLVRCYLFLSKINEALEKAKECRRLFPQSAQSLTLIGLVLSQPIHSAHRKKAKQCFEEALKMDSSCIDALFGLSQLFVADNNTAEAIQLLEQYLHFKNEDIVHARLGDIYVIEHKYNEAIHHYNSALR
jgi:tetratricopeptide (TPR) repeat protein